MCYISERELIFLKQYGDEQGLEKVGGRKITDCGIETFRRFAMESYTRLDCGCYAYYEEIVNHIKSHVDSLREHVADDSSG